MHVLDMLGPEAVLPLAQSPGTSFRFSIVKTMSDVDDGQSLEDGQPPAVSRCRAWSGQMPRSGARLMSAFQWGWYARDIGLSRLVDGALFW